VVWLGDHAEEPFRRAVNTARLHAAFDQLVGKGRWEPRHSLGTFPVRFPSQGDTGDTGWHVDASFAGEDSNSNDFLSWRVNVSSRGRALLMLFLFSDIDEKEAPTRIRVGSHLDVAKTLEPAGETGMRLRELAPTLAATVGRSEVIATGEDLVSDALDAGQPACDSRAAAGCQLIADPHKLVGDRAGELH